MTGLRLVVVGLFVMTAARAVAEPYMAVREGYKCSACHVNITGGGMRTEFVAVHARDILHYPNFFPSIATPLDSFTGRINQYIGIGSDLRVDYTTIFQDKPDENGQVDNNQVFRGRVQSNQITVNEADGYLEVRLIPDILTAYLDQSFAPQVNTREAWGLLRLPYDFFAKAGKMFLPYGLQIQDDTAFIRGGRNGSVTTGFSFQQQQAAFEAGWEGGPFSVITAVSDGSSGDRNVQVTGTAYTMLTDLPVVRNLLLGTSGSYVAPSGGHKSVFGFFGGSNLGQLTYLGEVDFLSVENQQTNGKTQGIFCMYTEANYLAFDWLNLKVAFDYADDDGDESSPIDDSENRFSVGLEPFFSRFTQFRLFYRIGNGVRSQPSHNQNLLTAELHVFF